ncbi:MAG: glycosyltransferase family 4 protein [Promethearchaeota archaeon]
MIKIRTYIGRKLNYINGILRRQIELDRYLKDKPDIKLEYIYYTAPKHPLDFIAKRYILFPISSKKYSNEKNVVNHITFQYLGDLGHFLNKNNTIITCHDIFTFIEKRNIKNPKIIQAYAITGLKKCKKIIAISNFTKNELISKLKIPESKIIVIKNGINNKIFYPMNNSQLEKVEPLFPGKIKILHVGTEAGRKDFLTLVKAFYLLKKKIKNIKLIRIGNPLYKNALKQMGLENDVVYISNISDSRLREIYNLCDVFVFPSLYEGWGAPGLEAAACGTPVICTNIPVFREVYQDFPLYFPPKDFKTLSHLMFEVLTNKSMKREMGKKNAKIIKQYSWKDSSKKYVKLIKKILDYNV